MPEPREQDAQKVGISAFIYHPIIEGKKQDRRHICPTGLKAHHYIAQGNALGIHGQSTTAL